MKSHSLRLGLLLSSFAFLGSTSVAVASPSVTAAVAPPVGGGFQEIGYMSCEITVTNAQGQVVADGAEISPTKFPVNVNMQITNHGDGTLAGITNRYTVFHRGRTTPPVPATEELANIAPGATLTRNFVIGASGLSFEQAGSADADYLRSIVEPDIEQVYATAGPEVPRKCEHRVWLVSEPL